LIGEIEEERMVDVGFGGEECRCLWVQTPQASRDGSHPFLLFGGVLMIRKIYVFNINFKNKNTFFRYLMVVGTLPPMR
jgi:hypothetical protein